MMLSPSPRDRREIRLVLTRLIAPVALGFITAVLLVRYNDRPVWKLVSDPTAAVHASPLLGILSNIGIIAWCAGAAIALFAAWLLARARAPRELVRFHAFAGALTTLLMADDFFLIHDDLAARYLGLPQNGVYSIYAVFFGLFLWRCRREFLVRNPAMFAIAISLLAFMAGADAVDANRFRFVGLAMSGSKLLGIFAWSAWIVLAARRDIETRCARDV